MLVRFSLFLIVSLVTYSLAAQETKSALFIGNSYTYFNNMPALIDNLAQDAGNDLIHDSSTPGGYQLWQHASNTTTLTKIAEQDWDFVIIQAQSQEPSFSPGQVAANTYPHAASLNDTILANNACTEPLFYMTWGRKNGDANNCPNYPPVCTYDGMQQRLKESYVEMAEDNDASVAPVGVAWKTVRDLYPSIELYNPDESHPSAEGSYLAACVFYVSMFRESVLGNSFIFSLDSLTAYRLQDIASSTVLDSMSVWGIGGNDLTVSLGDDTSLCTDSVLLTASGTYDNILWSTGDSSYTSFIHNSGEAWVSAKNKRACIVNDSVDVIIGIDPLINYTAQEFGNDSAYIYLFGENWDSIYAYDQLRNQGYPNQDTLVFVCDFYGYAIAWNNCGMDSITLGVLCGNINELDKNWSVGPNPTVNSLSVSNSDNHGFAYQLLDLEGREILYREFKNKSFQTIGLESLQNGNYILVLFDKHQVPFGKKIIQKK